jgi:hypothetical protein
MMSGVGPDAVRVDQGFAHFEVESDPRGGVAP